MASSIGELSSSRCVLLRLPWNAHRHAHTFQSNQLDFFLSFQIFYSSFFSSPNFFPLDFFFLRSYSLLMYPALCVSASLFISIVWTNDTDLKILNIPIHTFNFHFSAVFALFLLKNNEHDWNGLILFRKYFRNKYKKSQKEANKNGSKSFFLSWKEKCRLSYTHTLNFSAQHHQKFASG